MSITTKQFWKDTLEYAIRGAAHSVILFWGVGDGLLNLWEVNPANTAGIALGGFTLSVLTSLAKGAVPRRQGDYPG